MWEISTSCSMCPPQPRGKRGRRQWKGVSAGRRASTMTTNATEHGHCTWQTRMETSYFNLIVTTGLTDKQEDLNDVKGQTQWWCCVSLWNICMLQCVCIAALRWLREDVDIPDSRLHITLADFEVPHLSCFLLCSYIALTLRSKALLDLSCDKWTTDWDSVLGLDTLQSGVLLWLD